MIGQRERRLFKERERESLDMICLDMKVRESGGKGTRVGDEAHALVGVAVEQNRSGNEVFYTNYLISPVKKC